VAAESIFLDEDSTMWKILYNHLLELFYARKRLNGRRSFCAVIREGGFKVVTSREIQCCDIVIFETTLGKDDSVSPDIVRQSLTKYMRWELKH